MHFDKFMSKAELVRQLRAHAEKYGPLLEGVEAKILADFLEKADIPDKSHESVLPYLAECINARVEDDDTLPQPTKVLGIFCDRAPSLTALSSNEMEWMVREEGIGRCTALLEKTTKIPGLGIFLRGYWDAQYNTLWQLADHFKRVVWQKGLLEYVNNLPATGFRQQFGKTSLGVSELAGRVGIVLTRGRKRQQKIYFRAFDNDPYTVSPYAGQEASLSVAIEMVTEVTDRWQKEFKPK